MAPFSERSLANLAGVHPALVQLMMEVTEHYDCTILDGVRTREQQEHNVQAGLSRTLASKHLPQADGLGHAVDVAPTPQEWDRSPLFLIEKRAPTRYEIQCIAFLHYVKGFAAAQGLEVVIGVDWNDNNSMNDTSFFDVDHVELKHDNEAVNFQPKKP